MIGFVCLPEDVDSLVNATQEELQRLYEYPESFDGILTDVKRNLLKDFELDKQKNSFDFLDSQFHIQSTGGLEISE